MGKSGKRFYVATFGCRTNQADSAALRQDFLDAGYREAGAGEPADVIVVNSCTVTHRSDQQVRQMARRLRRENPAARLVVTGCYAQREPSALARIPGVDAVVGNTRKADLLQIAEDRSRSTAGGGATIHRDEFEKVRAIDLANFTQVGGRTRPFIKIQDGCDAKCTYCIIPSVRGPSRSVPPQQILSQVRKLVDRGFKEIVLTGIHIGTYGTYLKPRVQLDQLLERIVATPGLERVRISSIEPMELSKRVIDLAAENNTIAPHFHICLQSGSDRVLRKMLRPYTTARFASIVESIRERIPDAAIGTDVIAGFPGETDQDHRQSLEFVGRMPFTYLHVFPYSDRSGTEASAMSRKVPPDVRLERCRQFRDLSDRKNRDFRRSFIGNKLSVITLSERSQGLRAALSSNYLKVRMEDEVPANRIIEGVVVGEDAEELILGRFAPSEPEDLVALER